MVKSLLFILSLHAILFCLGSGCSVDSAKNHYLLAEKLWADQKYVSAVSEFEKVIIKDPRGKLGVQALFRAATTQSLFLSQNSDAVRKFKNFIQVSSDSQLIWEAQLQIGEILFAKTEQYEQAVLHYRSLLKDKRQASEAPEFLFRIAKSHFFIFQFDEAIESFQELIKKYPQSVLAEKAYYEIGDTYFTKGEQYSNRNKSGAESYQTARRFYRNFIQRYPKSLRVAEAKFGIASCLEELDQLDDAYQEFKELKLVYPSPRVIDVKLKRIRDRILQRNSSNK